MRDRLDDMQMELRKLNSNMDEMQMVNMMRDMMRLGFAGIEFMNSKLNLLQIDGWSEAISSEMHKYDPALRKLYQKWWRRSSTQPEVEILIGLGTSLIMHHAKNKMMRRETVPQHPRGARAQRAASVPFAMPSTLSESSDDSDGEEAPPPEAAPGVVRVDIL